MNDDYRPSQVQNATILLILAGALHIYLGYVSFQLSIMIPDPFQTTIGTIMIIFGSLTFCASLVVWLQNAWATKLIAVVGVAACAAAAIFAYYGMIIILAPIYWFAISQLKQVNEHSDWHED